MPQQESTITDSERYVSAFFTPCVSPEHLHAWILRYLGVDIPSGHVDPDSNSSPLEAMYEAYATYRDDTCFVNRGYIWLSARDCYKTLGGSILIFALMIHFKARVGHLAATKPQSEKCLEYLNSFVLNTKPLLEAKKRSVVGESKHAVHILNEDGSLSFVKVIVANLAGGNSEHTPVGTYDEIDTLSKQGLIGYKEAKGIPTRYKGRGPLRVKFSTRKFAFGIFEKEIQEAISKPELGQKVLRWNIIDVTERCDEARHKPELPRVVRYVSNELPLINITEEEANTKSPDEKEKLEKLEAFAGCASCKLLQVCKTRLAMRPKTESGGLYKKIDHTIGQFYEFDSDMATAQLLCQKPSASGLIYRRFSEVEGDAGNVRSVSNAYTILTGKSDPAATVEQLASVMVDLGYRDDVGIDWGFTHKFVMLVTARMPNGEWWLLDCYAIPGLETEDKLRYGRYVQATYGKVICYPDPADPASIKTFRRNGIKCVSFTKDVLGGIEAVRSQVIGGDGKRRLKVIRHGRTEQVVEMFRKHHFILDPAGNPTIEPDDEEFADIGDSLRYIGQNLFGYKRKPLALSDKKAEVSVATSTPQAAYAAWGQQLQAKVAELTGVVAKRKDGNAAIVWDFGEEGDA